MLSLNPFSKPPATPPAPAHDAAQAAPDAEAAPNDAARNESGGAPSASWPPADGPHMLRHDQIDASPLNPRRSRGFDEADIIALAESIARDGLLQNLTVRPTADADRFELIAGERRWRAIGRLIGQGLWDAEAANVKVAIRRARDVDAIRLALAENSVRRDMHELDEAEGLAALRELMIADGGEVGAVMDDLAGSYGRTRRWIEQRLALVAHLCDPVKAAWRDEAINLAMAKTLARFDGATQTSALANVSAGLPGWRLPAEVADTLSRGGLPVAAAIFAATEYDGPLELDDGGARVAYLDRAQATRLQMAAAQDLADAEEEGGARFADVVTAPEDLAAYVAGGAGAVVIVHPETLEVDVRRGLERRADVKAAAPDAPRAHPAPAGDLPAAAAHPDPAPGPATGDAPDHELGDTAGDAPDHELDDASAPTLAAAQGADDAAIGAAPSSPAAQAPASWPRAAWVQGARMRTLGLQDALMTAPTHVALAAFVAGCLASPHERGEVVKIGVRSRGSLGQDVLLETCQAVGLTDHVTLFGRSVETRDAAGLFDALVDLDDEALNRVVVALIAAQIEVSDDGPGDARLTLALADAVQAEDALCAGFVLDHEYLDAYPVEHLRALARDMGLNAEAMPRAKADAIAWILENPARDEGWTPLELVYATPEETRAEVARLLTPPRAAAAE